MPAPLTWIDDLRRVCANERCVLVTLMIVSGSAPRESGSRMIVTGREILGSVGGGNLEFKAIEKARALLGPSQQTLAAQPFLFGAEPTLADAALYGNLAMLESSSPDVLRALGPTWTEYMQRLNDYGARQG